MPDVIPMNEVELDILSQALESLNSCDLRFGNHASDHNTETKVPRLRK